MKGELEMSGLNGRCLQLLLCFSLAMIPASAQTSNLLQNPDAELDARHWQAWGQATIEEINGNKSFVLRNQGYYYQEVILPDGAVGQYAVFVGRGLSERINADGAITGLPYLYGYMLPPVDGTGGKSIKAYLQGQRMLGQARSAGEWVIMWGIFKVPEGTGRIGFYLHQAERKGVPQNGSAASFDDLGLYLFPTEDEAKAFVARYH
jgi:hypothetical protein